MKLRYTGLIEEGIPGVLPMVYPGEVIEVSDELAEVLLTRSYEEIDAELGRDPGFEQQANEAYMIAAKQLVD